MYDSGAPTRITINKAGFYTVSAGGQWAVDSTGRRYVRLRLNGTTIISGTDDVAAGSIELYQSTARSKYFALNDYIEMVVLHTKGSNLAITENYLTATYLGTD